MNIVEKMFPGVDKKVEKISDSQYKVSISSFPLEIEGDISMSAKEMRFDIKRIKNGNHEYIVTKQFYKRPNTDSITRIGDVIVVTNIKVETPTRKTNHTTNYRINLEYLFSIPVRSFVNTNRSVYTEISFYKITKLPAYITLETKNEKYSGQIIEDIEKAILMYEITESKINLRYYDVMKPIEIDTINATVYGGGKLQKIYKAIKRIFRP